MKLIGLLALAVGFSAVAQAQTATPPDLLTAASLEKLKSITLSSSNKTSTLDARVVKMLGMGKDGDAITVKQFKAETAVGLYVFTLPVKPVSDDVVFSFRDPSGVTYNYLSDGGRALRAAMASDADGTRILTRDEAQAGFREALKAWGMIAARVKAP